jgi:hypothetical protein
MKEDEKTKIFLSKFLNAELLGLIFGVKKIQRGVVAEKEYADLEALYNELGFFVEPSDFKVIIRDGLQKKLSDPEQEGQLIFFASKNKKNLSRLKNIENSIYLSSGDQEHRRNSIKEGLMLGYPLCCIKYFLGVQNLPTPAIYFKLFKDSKGHAKAELNPFHKMSPVSHIPCSCDCARSVAYAKKLLKKIKTDRAIFEAAYLYFKDGHRVELLRENSSGPKRYRVGSVSFSDFGQSAKNNAAINKILSKISPGDSIEINKGMSLYRNNKKIFSAAGKNKNWTFVDFR